MAIAFDASSFGNTTGTSLTVAHTCTGSNRILMVAIFGATTDTLTGVTYGGTAMTLVASKQQGSSRFCYLYYLIAPATGANNIVASFSGSTVCGIAAASYTGAKQSGQPDASTTNGANTTNTLTTSVTSIADNCWHVLAGMHQDGTPTAGTGSTFRADDDFGGVGIVGIFDSNGPKTPAGSYSMTYTGAGSGNNPAAVMASIAPLADTIAITTPVTRQARQINGSSQASIPITGTYVGSPTAIEASFNGGAYATIDAAPAGGTYSGTLSAQAAGQGTLTVRWTNNTSISATATLITLSDVFVVGGDSRSEGRLTNRQTDAGTAKSVVFTQNDAWISTNEASTGVSCDPGATTGTFVPLIASLYYAKHSRPCAFITCGTGSTDVGPTTGTHKEWTKGQSAYTEMNSQITAAATAGVKGGLFWFGPNALADIPTLAAYNTSIDTFLSDFASDFNTSASANPKCIIDIHGECGTSGLSAANLRLAHDRVRGAVKLARDDNAQLPAVYFQMEENYADDVHPVSDAQALRVARRLWMSMENTWYSGTYSVGPQVSSAIIDAGLTTITVTVNRDLTGANGTTYGGFRVTDSGTPKTITSATKTAARTIDVIVSVACSSAANTLLTFAGSDDAVGQTIPTTAAQTLPDTNTETLPMETTIDYQVTNQLSRAMPFGTRSTAFNGGRTFTGTIR